MTDLQKKLLLMKDPEYVEFQAKLTPTIEKDKFLGVRVPELRTFAKEFYKTPECEKFLNTLPHEYYDENLLHSILLNFVKDYDKLIEYIDAFLPYVDCWAVCDTLSPKVFKKHKEELILKIKEWSASDEIYTCRFGLQILMNFYLDEDFDESYFEMPLNAKSDEYYVKMMVAWYFATALAKQWDAAIKVVESKTLVPWTHNKTIQKAKESYRITDEQKAYLQTLKV